MRLLDVKAQTLYAYVSRGWIRRVRIPGGGKHSLYSREDVEKLKARAKARTGHGPTAASAMRWGEPIIPTSITEITAEGPSYRGRLAVDLARSGATFEHVAGLLWTGGGRMEPASWPVSAPPSALRDLARHVASLRPEKQLMEVFALYTLTLGMSRRMDADPLLAAREIVQTLVGCVGFLGPGRAFVRVTDGSTVAAALLRALGLASTAHALSKVQAMLVLLADHELPPSTFTARVAASTGASLHACIVSALAANSGVAIGRMYDGIEDFLRTYPTASRMMAEARKAQAAGRVLPGFNHPLYPHGDPRGRLLLALARATHPLPRRVAHLLEFLDEAERTLGAQPRVEMGVVGVCEALRLPKRAAGALFTVSRCAGWIAHVLEHRLAGYMLRPRALYSGRPPSQA